MSEHDGPEYWIDVQFACPRRGVPAAPTFRWWAEAALRATQAPAGEMVIRVVDAEEGRTLNRQWRKRDRATNVLSFPGEALAGLPWQPLGDIVICAPVVRTEAAQQGKSERAHWAHMTVHGVLHLLGHDHQSPREAEQMEGIERRLLVEFGYPDPYLWQGGDDTRTAEGSS